MQRIVKEVRINTPMFNAIVGRMERKQALNIDGVNYRVDTYKRLNSKYYRFEMVEVK